MKNNLNKNQVLNRAVELLPWYAVGKLTPADLEFMDEALASYPELKKQLDTEKTTIQLIKNDPDILGYSALEAPEDRVEHVLKLLAPQETLKESAAEATLKLKGVQPQSKFQQFIAKLFPKNQQFGSFTYASFAVVFLTAVFSLLYIFNGSHIKQESVFYPATNQAATDLKNKSDETVLLLGVNGRLDSHKLLKLLEKVDADITAVPNKAGMYRIKLGKKLNSITINALLDELRAEKELVWFAGESN
ncbi:MAG TPA: hypothetical protein EYG71_03600 [Leucothrix sp.]|nr:hypothetical protein [Leucothrix sp.]